MSTPPTAAAELNHKQLREAAERILTNKHYNYWECNWAQNAMTDGALLARAYLALAPAEDEQPLDEAFAESLGWYRDGTNDAYTHNHASIWLERSSRDKSIWIAFAEVYELGSMRTRRQLVQLHEALGIPLAVAVEQER